MAHRGLVSHFTFRARWVRSMASNAAMRCSGCCDAVQVLPARSTRCVKIGKLLMKHLLRSPISCERIRNWLGHAAVGAAVHPRAALVSDATGRRCLAGTSLRSTPALFIDARGGLHFIGLRDAPGAPRRQQPDTTSRRAFTYLVTKPAFRASSSVSIHIARAAGAKLAPATSPAAARVLPTVSQPFS